MAGNLENNKPDEAFEGPVRQQLLRDDLILSRQLQEALALQRKQGGLLGEILIGLGALSEEEYQRSCARAHGVRFYSKQELLSCSLSQELFRSIPYQVALNHYVLPIAKDGKGLELVCLGPLPESLRKQLKFQTQCASIRTHLSTREALGKAIHAHYGSYLRESSAQSPERSSQAPREGFCPQCAYPLPPEVAVCPRCEHLLQQPSGDPLLGQLLDNRWKLVERLGEGGMGMVYKGIHVQRQTPVGIKLLRAQPTLSERTVQRFYQEAQILRHLEHPGIIDVYRFGYEADIGFYLVMELLQGLDLQQYLRKYKQISLSMLCRIFMAVSDAMHYAHEENVVHRDLKPENIFLIEPDDLSFKNVKILDFGIAKSQLEELSLTRTGMTMGTPRYLSPEQAMGKPVDRRADIYSMCVILFEVLTGKGLFEADSPYQYALRHIYTEPALLSAARPDIPYPSSLQTLLAQGLSKVADKRPDSMTEVKALLRESLHAVDDQRIEIHYHDLRIFHKENSAELQAQGPDTPALPTPLSPVSSPDVNHTPDPSSKPQNLLPPPSRDLPPQQFQAPVHTPTPTSSLSGQHSLQQLSSPPTKHNTPLSLPSNQPASRYASSPPHRAKPLPPPPAPARPSRTSLPEFRAVKPRRPVFLWFLCLLLLAFSTMSFLEIPPVSQWKRKLQRAKQANTQTIKASFGYLDLQCKPKHSYVRIDKQTLIRCPAFQLPLPQGTHDLAFSHPGYRTQTLQIHIKAGQTVRLSPTLPPTPRKP